MNGVALFIGTFFVWITVKGRLPNYVALVTTAAATNSGGNSANNGAAPTPARPASSNLPAIASPGEELTIPNFEPWS